MDNKIIQRKKILINKRVQIKYTAIIMGLLFVMIVIMGRDFYYAIKTIFTKAFIADEISRNLTAFYVVFIVKSFVFMVLAAGITIYFSHRVTGPIYRLEKDLLIMISEGDLTKQFRLRKNDEFKELSDALNAMVSNLRTRLLVSEQFHEEARAHLNEVLKILKEKETITKEDKNLIVSKIEDISNFSAVSPVSFKI
ncbi:MAG: hypothetical protein PHE88_09455 [Elusimicrobia bacterium]|nr:hypothetical protein [Elusimicrobiota bacterium]